MAAARGAEAKKTRQEKSKIKTKKKLHFSMKGKRYADVDAIQKASTVILNAMPKDDLTKSFDNLLDRANRCIQCEWDFFEGDQ